MLSVFPPLALGDRLQGNFEDFIARCTPDRELETTSGSCVGRDDPTARRIVLACGPRLCSRPVLILRFRSIAGMPRSASLLAPSAMPIDGDAYAATASGVYKVFNVCGVRRSPRWHWGRRPYRGWTRSSARGIVTLPRPSCR